MDNNGFLQATIAYKVSKPGGQPIDINGDLVSTSGLRQAVALLLGTPNPDPNTYEIAYYFTENGTIFGNPTVEYDPEDCPTGIIYLNPSRLVLAPNGDSVEVILFSSSAWVLETSTAIATVSLTNGLEGFNYLEITPTNTEGQDPFIFKNTDTGDVAELYVVNSSNPDLWVLDGGTWQGLGFWFSNGIWNF